MSSTLAASTTNESTPRKQFDLNAENYEFKVQGSNSKIYFHQTLPIVLKFLPAQHPNECRKLKKEFQMLKQMTHVNVIRIEPDAFQEEVQFDGQEGCFMQMPQAGSILMKFHKTYKYLNMKKIKSIFIQCATGLNYAHSRNIVHGDFKAENVLAFEQGKKERYKIADFGYGNKLRDRMTPDEIVDLTIETYKDHHLKNLSPEIRELIQKVQTQNFENWEGEIDLKKADVYSFGFTMFTITYQVNPFLQKGLPTDNIYGMLSQKNYRGFWDGIKQQIMLIQGEKYLQNLDQMGFFGKELRNLFQSMLCAQIKQRINLEQVIEHEFFYTQ